MNIVRIILDLLSGDLMKKLSGVLGVSEAKAESAVHAAVPTLLTALSRMVSTPGGAETVSNALKRTDPGMLDRLGGLMSDDPGAVSHQGGSLIKTLFGDNLLAGIVKQLVGHIGLDSRTVQQLLNFVMPMVMGMVAKQFSGKAITPSGLTSFFKEQESNISSMMPSGIKLDDLSPRREPAPAARMSHQPAPSRAMQLWPLWAIAALALLALFFWPREREEVPTEPEVVTNRPIMPEQPVEEEIEIEETDPALPEVPSATDSLGTGFDNLKSALSGIRDAASAQAALPALDRFSDRLDGMADGMMSLPAAAKSALSTLVKTQLSGLQDEFNRVLMIPGVADVIRPALEGVVDKLKGMVGLSSDEFQLPSMEAAEVGSHFTTLLKSLTGSLAGIQDAESAQDALPKLQEVESQLESTLEGYRQLPQMGKGIIDGIVSQALVELRQLAERVLEIPGVGDVIRPVVTSIMEKLESFSS